MTEQRAAPERVVVPSVRFTDPMQLLAETLGKIREDLELSAQFSAEVEAEAAATVAAAVLPDDDRTAMGFITIDPEGATDLDQAVHIARAGNGFVVSYAIADVPTFVTPGGAVDAEARRRGQTLYAPDGRVPLHPTVISEHAASLREGEVRGAYLWSFELDADANVTATSLCRARVRSRQQLSYAAAQAAINDGTASETLLLLREVGQARIVLERERGGASLDRPVEEIEFADGRYRLVRRSPLPVEAFNAQVSLMTGMAAATIMIEGGVGILRTMPPPDDEALAEFRRKVAAIGCPWPDGVPYGTYLAQLDRDDPRALAALHSAASLFRGAGYTAFDNAPPETVMQAAVGAPYAHATAPLRRLVDRFVLVACEALANGRDVPDWVRGALPDLPGLMASSSQLGSRLDHSAVDAIEAALLVDRVGQTFDATAISTSIIQLDDPVVTARVQSTAPTSIVPGARILATLVAADIAQGTVLFRA